MLASKLYKGMKVEIHGVVVRVTKREKWNSRDVKIHFEDCGNGLPYFMMHGKPTTFTQTFMRLTDQVEVL